MFQLNRFLHRLHLPITAVALLFILYCSTYLWFYVPYEDFTFVWRPDSHLVVNDVPPDSIVAGLLQPGDEILAIGGQPIQRMRPIYPLPLQSSYEYIIVRDGETLSTTISFSRQVTWLAVRLRLPAVLLSITGWFVGAIILFFARRDNTQGIHAGYIFLLSSTIIVGVQSALNGVPGAWVVGQVLLFLQPPFWVYLGLIPRAGPLTQRTRLLLQLLVILASFLALAAIYEVLVLFPTTTSFEEVIGVSLYSLAFFLSGLGLLACVAILAWRAFRISSTSYLRQQLIILLLFFSLGILPAVLLTILPRALFDVTPLPFPIAIGLMLLIPAGYLFVIYRKGFLGLDLFFSRTIYLVLLSLFVFGFYISGLYLVQRFLNLSGAEAVGPATVIFFPTLLLTVYTNRSIHQFVDRLVYGKAALSQETLGDLLHAVSTRPELDTLSEIVASLAQTMDVARAALLIKGENGYLTAVATIGDNKPTILPDVFQPFHHPVLRSIETASGTEKMDRLFASLGWAEVLLPVIVRGEQFGVLALSRPGPDGFFNARQITFLDQAAGVLAVGTENILLFEATRRTARQMQVIREDERRRLSIQLHDDPLHQVTYATTILDHVLVKHFPGTQVSENGNEIASRLTVAGEHMRKAARSLRNICHDLHLPFQDQGLQVAVEEIASRFQEEYELPITLDIALPEEIQGHISEKIRQAACCVLNGALLNVIKHAPGARVGVKLTYEEDSLILSVADNGPGSHVSELSYTELIRRGHLGLVSMHEWAEHAGGRLRFLANQPMGVEVLLACPLRGSHNGF